MKTQRNIALVSQWNGAGTDCGPSSALWFGILGPPAVVPSTVGCTVRPFGVLRSVVLRWIVMGLISSLLAAATEMPAVGSVAPDFTLPAQDGSKVQLPPCGAPG